MDDAKKQILQEQQLSALSDGSDCLDMAIIHVGGGNNRRTLWVEMADE